MAERRGTKALELWCRRMTEGYPGVKIDNMTTSWRDGLAFCAMIHHFRPDLIEFDKLNKEDVYYNNELAFTTAEKYLGIPALLDADDMAAYQVPDRLSILTYLSQFYQVFAAQNSTNRLKRPSSAVEKTQISKTAGPPTKMAHVVGVPKRDPCHKCNLPVFLAERLAVGKRIYHRTCLKCARCGSQLTPGSFYETEKDGEYVCETCPDEEVINDNNGTSFLPTSTASDYDVELRGATSVTNTLAPPPRTGRSSIADRLAFFEQNKQSSQGTIDQKLLQKSVSDEEKSQSLKRMEQHEGAYKPNNAFSKFMHDTTDGEVRAETPDASETATTITTSSETHMDTSDTEAEVDDADLNEMPQLPSTQAPVELLAEAATTPSTPPITPKPRFTATAALKLKTEVDDHAEPKSMLRKTEIQMQLSDATNNNNNNSNNDNDNVNDEQTTTPTKMLDLSVSSVSEASVTKEPMAITTADEHLAPVEQQTKRAKSSIQITLNDQRQESNETSTDDGDMTQDVELRRQHSPTKVGAEDAETTERLSVVRARLQQFEVIANKTTKTKPTTTTATIEHDEKSSPSANHSPPQQPLETATTTTEHVDPQKIEKEQTPLVPETPIVAALSTTTIDMEINDAGAEAAAVEAKSVDDLEDLVEDNENKVPLEDPTKDLEQVKHDEKETLERKIEEREVEIRSEEKGIAENNEAEKDHDDEPMQVAHATDEVVDHLETEEKDTAVYADENLKVTEMATESSDTGLPISESTETIRAEASGPILTDEQQVKPIDDNVSGNTSNSSTITSKVTVDSYPKDLDPFKSDDDDDDEANNEQLLNKENLMPVQLRTPQPRTLTANQSNAASATKSQASLNPFDSSDDEIELEKSAARLSAASTPLSAGKVPPPRPPPPRISRNPFGDDSEQSQEDAANFSRRSSLSSSMTKTRTPVPTPRSNISQSQNPTPEPTPRLSNKSAQSVARCTNGHSDYYGSDQSLTPHNLLRNSELRSSNNSLASSAGGTMRARKSRRAPLPPSLNSTASNASPASAPVKELFPSTETLNSSMTSSPSTSTRTSPKSARKKRPAPAPPKPARLDPAIVATSQTGSKNSFSYPLQSELDSKLSDEEKALLEGKPHISLSATTITSNTTLSRQGSRRIIPIDMSLIDDETGDNTGNVNGDGKSDDFKTKLQQQGETENGDSHIIYRRRILVPPKMDTPTTESNPLFEALQQEHDRQLEKLKDNKEAQNRNRQSQISSTGSSIADELESAMYYNKSAHGKWKRRKGPAPALPVPPRKVLQMLPLQEIRQELEIIEVQQQGLEKQGVILEKMIRDRCEDERGQPLENMLSKEKPESDGDSGSGSSSNTQNSKEVEDLILQLFELVNEKNELFRRQAELMYLRRQHRLEQEQADLEYEIRVLMAQPERNKTDTDKAREEALIARLVEVVQQRNDVVERLEMDRLREHEEDLSIKQRLEMHTAMRETIGNAADADDNNKMQKLSKKEKKKQKEVKKLNKNKKLDADKDADESELKSSEKDKDKTKKKKKKFLFIN